ncbi:hypothetical protein L228DRAFT_157652 [Xylona heveae TC161]|uniref:Uncharacterized protein n=1 Tax=Xylona heveae (strain CBS 132557 / TC161) TaxID=1328760 RepID=A0A165G2U6_XYLHT|nr:hypothetical protein L228DRAFT_157652 [Xylona heveae TC161]KZF21676.1 hypothetical protein L228DRAFT_157652 [Xylona heveae TC161]
MDAESGTSEMLSVSDIDAGPGPGHESGKISGVDGGEDNGSVAVAALEPQADTESDFASIEALLGLDCVSEAEAEAATLPGSGANKYPYIHDENFTFPSDSFTASSSSASAFPTDSTLSAEEAFFAYSELAVPESMNTPNTERLPHLAYLENPTNSAGVAGPANPANPAGQAHSTYRVKSGELTDSVAPTGSAGSVHPAVSARMDGLPPHAQTAVQSGGQSGLQGGKIAGNIFPNAHNMANANNTDGSLVMNATSGPNGMDGAGEMSSMAERRIMAQMMNFIRQAFIKNNRLNAGGAVPARCNMQGKAQMHHQMPDWASMPDQTACQAGQHVRPAGPSQHQPQREQAQGQQQQQQQRQQAQGKAQGAKPDSEGLPISAANPLTSQNGIAVATNGANQREVNANAEVEASNAEVGNIPKSSNKLDTATAAVMPAGSESNPHAYVAPVANMRRDTVHTNNDKEGINKSTGNLPNPVAQVQSNNSNNWMMATKEMQMDIDEDGDEDYNTYLEYKEKGYGGVLHPGWKFGADDASKKRNERKKPQPKQNKKKQASQPQSKEIPVEGNTAKKPEVNEETFEQFKKGLEEKCQAGEKRKAIGEPCGDDNGNDGGKRQSDQPVQKENPQPQPQPQKPPARKRARTTGSGKRGITQDDAEDQSLFVSEGEDSPCALAQPHSPARQTKAAPANDTKETKEAEEAEEAKETREAKKVVEVRDLKQQPAAQATKV